MAIIKEDGTGLANANSYADVADADTYFADKNELGWGGDTAFKEFNLINATTAIDALYGPRYISYLRDEVTQSLLWPREQIWDRHSRRIQDAVPISVFNATMEMALLKLQGVDLFPEGNTDNDIVATSVTIGEISESKTFQSTNKQQATFSGFREIELILWPILLPVTRKIAFSI